MSTKTASFLKRFAKGFTSAGLVAMSLQLNAGVTVHSFADLKQFAFSLSLAFFTGGLLAVEKMWNWKEY